jgi:hypothetical protein
MKILWLEMAGLYLTNGSVGRRSLYPGIELDIVGPFTWVSESVSRAPYLDKY